MRLPTYQDLSKEQDRINNLPLKGSYLVTGPPGTGKTVMALYRSKMITDRGEKVRLLMHGKLLSQYTKQAVAALGIAGAVTTFWSWLGGLCMGTWKKRVPQLADWIIDWDTIIRWAIEKPPKPGSMAYLQIDEGQDMPPVFFTFARRVANQLTVFADENQRITEQNSTLDEIRQRMKPDDESQLTRNYRNTREIAEVASHFYRGVETGVPDLPSRSGPVPTLRHHPRLHESVQHIANFATTNRHQQIGVILLYGKTVKKYVNRLEAKGVPVQFYLRESGGGDVKFDEPGVVVVTWASAKGLEFDTVFVPELQDIQRDLQDPTLMMQLYVLCSRAREQLVLSYSGDGRPAILDILPMNKLDLPDP